MWSLSLQRSDVFLVTSWKSILSEFFKMMNTYGKNTFSKNNKKCMLFICNIMLHYIEESLPPCISSFLPSLLGMLKGTYFNERETGSRVSRCWPQWQPCWLVTDGITASDKLPCPLKPVLPHLLDEVVIEITTLQCHRTVKNQIISNFWSNFTWAIHT